MLYVKVKTAHSDVWSEVNDSVGNISLINVKFDVWL